MHLTPSELADIFAEAQRLGRERFHTGFLFVRRTPRPEPLQPVPLATTRVAGCPCGGWLELRVGLSRPVHVGQVGCRARR